MWRGTGDMFTSASMSQERHKLTTSQLSFQFFGISKLAHLWIVSVRGSGCAVTHELLIAMDPHFLRVVRHSELGLSWFGKKCGRGLRQHGNSTAIR